VYNIATGQPTSLLDLVAAINEVLGAKLSVIHDRGADDSSRHLWANIVQAQTELGYCPCTDLMRDLRSCLTMYPESLEADPVQVRWDGPTTSRGQRPVGITSAPSLANETVGKVTIAESR
jgi:hypothetical protein